MKEIFTPKDHKFPIVAYFEDLKLGEKYYIPSRTLADANFAAFQLASGDNHPIHYDVEYCRERGFQIYWRTVFKCLSKRPRGLETLHT